MVIGISVIVVSAFTCTNCFMHSHCTNCKSGNMEKRSKATSAFSFNTHHCREALLILPCDKEYSTMVHLEK